MSILTVSNTGAPFTFVCVHGFLGSPEDWAPFCSLLGQYGNVALVNLPGHNGESVGPPASISDIAAHILDDLYKSFPDSSFILIGYLN